MAHEATFIHTKAFEVIWVWDPWFKVLFNSFAFKDTLRQNQIAIEEKTKEMVLSNLQESFVSFPEMYRELSRNDLITLTLSYDEKVKALTEEVCVLQKEMHQAR